MNKFNLSEWALNHRSLMWFFMIIATAAGALSYINLGREEDPSFTIKTMLVSAQWPGASAEDVTKQVTERIERKLQELPALDFTRSMTTSGSTIVFVNLKQTTPGRQVPENWKRVRDLIGDIASEFPKGATAPSFNDSFGDVYGNIYALTTDGLSQRQLRDYAEDIRSRVLALSNAGKVDLLGAQDEKIFLEFSTQQLAAMGLDRNAVLAALQAQNAIVQSGEIDTKSERISIRVGGQFASEDSLRSVNLRVNDRFFRLSDVATIKRGYADPPVFLFRYNGQPAIGLAIGMRAGGNLVHFGEELRTTMDDVARQLPAGVDLHLVADQPEVVHEAVGGFLKALFEAVVIVLAVSFVSLGFRAGFVVALTIPLVLAITFIGMDLLGISLQRISLGALIIALGLLVDDAMIAIEMMVARLEAGDSLRKAATAVYTTTAFPMLTGTLVTMASFMPVGLNNSAAGEYTFTLFVVIAVSLLLSWIVAVLFSPLLGVTFLPKTMKAHHQEPSQLMKAFKAVVRVSLTWKWTTVFVTVGLFALSIWGFRFVEVQFFPPSDRVELVVDWTLPQNASIAETKAQMDRFETTVLAGDADVDHWTSYVGRGAARFVLTLDVQVGSPNYGQLVIVPKSVAGRDRLRAKIAEATRRDFVGTDVMVALLPLGPPPGRAIQYRVTGPSTTKVREIAQQVAGVVSKSPLASPAVFDWSEPARVLKVNVLQDKARQLGVSSQDISQAISGTVAGSSITQIRDSIYLVDVIGRAENRERSDIGTIENLQIAGSNGQQIPLSAVATFDYEQEQPVIWRRNRLPTITVKASVLDATQPATVVESLTPQISALTASLPAGYKIEVAGPVEDSGKSQAPIAAVIPVMLLVMAVLLMVQLQSFSRLFLVMSVAPLALIGVVAALVPSRAPLGFVAILGVFALIGILIRNAVILVDQIERLRADGMAAWDAVLEATITRTRPIFLTAAAASLALIPISREVFWGPMAYAMMGGIIVGTFLTLFFLPALYAVSFRLRPTARTTIGQPESND